MGLPQKLIRKLQMPSSESHTYTLTNTHTETSSENATLPSYNHTGHTISQLISRAHTHTHTRKHARSLPTYTLTHQTHLDVGNVMR